MTSKATRIWELDALRGVAILMMLAFHFIFDLEVFFGIKGFDHMNGFWFYEGRISAILFIMLVGVASSLIARRYDASTAYQKNASRGLKLIALGLIITLATFIVDRPNTIWFGILHFLGTSILISIPLAKYKKLNFALGTFLLLAYFQVSKIYSLSYLGLIFGILPPSFQTYDHYSLIPWLGFVLWGMALGNWLYPAGDPLLKRPPNLPEKGLIFAGKYSLWIYLVHQPIFLGILWLILK